MARHHPRAQELRALPDAELLKQEATLRQEGWQRRQHVKEGAQAKPHEIAAVRRQIARVLTVLSERRAPRYAGPRATEGAG
jgi:ribosomal protein L29